MRRSSCGGGSGIGSGNDGEIAVQMRRGFDAGYDRRRRSSGHKGLGFR